jgi:hypothetical protein
MLAIRDPLLAPLLGAALVGCSFTGSGNAGDGDGDGDGDIDAGSDAGPDADMLCDELTLNLQIDGADATDFVSKREVTVGDSIALNAGQSCSPTGNLEFTWSFGAGDFELRDSASMTEPFIELYPDRAGDLTLTITIDGGGSPLSQEIPIVGDGFAAVDALDGSPIDVREMAVSDDRLWLAAESGAYTQPLANLGARPYMLVNDDATVLTATIPDDITDVTYDGVDDVVTFLPADGSAAFFFDRVADAITSYVPVTPMATGTMVDALAIGGGVRILTDKRTETSMDYVVFAAGVDIAGATTLGTQGNDLLAGGTALFRLDEAGDTIETLEIFNQGVNDPDVIAALFVDTDGLLWIGSDAGLNDTGIGVIDNFDDNTVTPHLLGQQIRAIAQDSAGDMWVASAAGVHRFKSDWGIWIDVIVKHGLADLDVKALIVDEAGGRDRIIVGTATDVFILDRQ